MTSQNALSRWALTLYCLATGFSVAAVVYHQSMTQLIAVSFGLSADSLWGLSVATQFGYGAGLILGLPLGDMIAPRRLIPATMLALGAVLLLVGIAPSPWLMVLLCGLAGLLSIAGQLLLAYSAKALAAEQRGRVVGSLLTSLFAGLLLARVLAGWGGEHIGWRGIYLTVGALTFVIGLALRGCIGEVPLAGQLRYGRMLSQQGALWLKLPELRRLALVAACFFAASNGIWANLSSLTHATLNWNAGQTGLLAFTSIAALRAPWLAQRLQRRLDWHGVIALLGVAIAATSLAGVWLGSQVLMIVAFLMVTDLGVRSVQTIAQGRVLGIDPAAASRLNSLFMTVFFFGAALGSWLGGVAIHRLGWAGMYLFPAACAAAGLLFLSWRNPALRFARA